MRAKQVGLTNSVGGTYDKTRTSIFGRVAQKTINSELVLGPPLTKFIDVYTDSGNTLTLGGVVATTPANRLWALTAISGGVGTLIAYSFNPTTGASSYLGRVLFNMPNSAATTHTVRYLRVDDANTSNIKVMLGTSGSVAVNGGNFLINKLALADLTTGPSPITIPMATASDVRAVYMMMDPTAMGAANNMTTLVQAGFDRTNSELLVNNGTAASFVFHGFDMTVAPTWTSQSVNVTVAAPGKVQYTAHPFSTNDQVTFISGTLPTGLTLNTVYFVRNPTANDFELSTTSGGASITTTGSPGTAVIGRAFGQSSTNYKASRKTGTITSGFSGTAILLDGGKIVTMADGPNAGQKVFFFSTTSNFYCFQLTDITAGATTLPTAAGINNLGTGTDIVLPSTVLATYSEVLGKIVYASSAFNWLMKTWVNSTLFADFGGQFNQWFENSSDPTFSFRGIALNGIEVGNGWLFVSMSTTGQRGILAVDLQSDARFEVSYFTSAVVDTGTFAGSLNFVTTIEELYDYTDTLQIYYRSSDDPNDTLFNSVSGGWTAIPEVADLSSYAFDRYLQFKVYFNIASELSGTPAQVHDIVVAYEDLTQCSDYWAGDNDNTTQGTGSPNYLSFVQRSVYSSYPSTFYVRAYDAVGTSVINLNTTANSALFSYSTDGGTSWTPGVGPNTAGKRLRALISSPPNVLAYASIRES